MFKYLSIFLLLSETTHSFQVDYPSPKLHLDPLVERIFWEHWSSYSTELSFSLFTIPRSGSHLAIKLLYLLTGACPQWHMTYPLPESDRLIYPYTHLYLSPELKRAHELHSPGRKKIVNIRDLRDVCVSIVHYILNTGEWPEFGDKKKLAAFRNSSFDDQLLWVIQQDYDVVDKRMIQLSMGRVAKQAVEYLNDPSVLVICYENLVGPNGGGSHEAQIGEIEKMENYLGVPINRNFIELIPSLLYGDSTDPFTGPGLDNFHSTFRRGSIGKWKEVFNTQHKKAFKRVMGDALIALGYETDNNW